MKKSLLILFLSITCLLEARRGGANWDWLLWNPNPIGTPYQAYNPRPYPRATEPQLGRPFHDDRSYGPYAPQNGSYIYQRFQRR